MAIDGLGQLSNEQLLAMNMVGNGQITSDESGSSNSTSDETNLAFQLVMKNLTESAKNSAQKDVAALTNSKNKENDKVAGDKSSKNAKATDTANIGNATAAKAIQKYLTGQKLQDIPMVLNNNYVNFAGNSGGILSNRSDVDMKKIYSAVNNAAKKYGVDSNLIMAVIKQESDYDPYSTSDAGAKGLMQIMPENFAHLGITNGYDVDQNVNGGTKLLKEYLDKYNGNTEMALMAYNAGPGTIQRRGVSSANDLYKMPGETQNYVPKVMGYFRSGI